MDIDLSEDLQYYKESFVLGLTGFYNYHGLTFWQFASRLLYYSFFNRPLVYRSTESVEGLKQLFLEEKQEQKLRQEKAEKEEKKKKKEDVHMVRRKAIRIVVAVIGLFAAGAAAAAWYKYNH